MEKPRRLSPLPKPSLQPSNLFKAFLKSWFFGKKLQPGKNSDSLPLREFIENSELNTVGDRFNTLLNKNKADLSILNFFLLEFFKIFLSMPWLDLINTKDDNIPIVNETLQLQRTTEGHWAVEKYGLLKVSCQIDAGWKLNFSIKDSVIDTPFFRVETEALEVVFEAHPKLDESTLPEIQGDFVFQLYNNANKKPCFVTAYSGHRLAATWGDRCLQGDFFNGVLGVGRLDQGA